MISGWKQYSIFISSTFVDMDEERDIIKFQVVNRLNSHFSARKISFQVIDLRSGINTELFGKEERERRILDVCFNSIDTSRPFFIGLLGERYGWIPPKDKYEYIVSRLPQSKKALLEGSEDASVTEMEILYGAIGNNGEHIDHSLFFYRSPESYREICEAEEKPFYDYEDGIRSERAAQKRDRLPLLMCHQLDGRGAGAGVQMASWEEEMSLVTRYPVLLQRVRVTTCLIG